ncbi:MAG: adenylate/guanylate cyclase domain-containing protein [Rhodospirillales bacterium]
MGKLSGVKFGHLAWLYVMRVLFASVLAMNPFIASAQYAGTQNADYNNAAFSVRIERDIEVWEFLQYGLPVAVVVLIIIALFVYANRKLTREVAERKKVEVRLRDREAWSRSLMDSVPDATLILNPEGIILSVNNRTEELFGIDREHLIGETFELLIPDNQSEHPHAHRHEFIATSEPRFMSADRNLKGKRQDGTLFPVEISLSPVETADGILTAAMVRDVTTRKTLEKALQDKDRELVYALENMFSGMFMIDQELRMRIYNQEFCKLFQLPDIDPGTPIRDLLMMRAARGDYGPGDPEKIVAERLAGYRNRETAFTEDIVQGGRIIAGVRQPTDDGGMVCVFNDITERRNAEQVLAEQSEKLQLLADKLSRHLSPQVYDAIFSGASDADVQTERKKLTIFFSDIKDFTATTEEMEPEDMTFLLNDYMTKMSEIALEFGGTIDKYIGDAIMIFFGDPETRGVKKDALAATRMAIAMQRRMVDLRAKWSDMGYHYPFHIRCGINTGYCNVGNFGSEQRVVYTIIGGQVNLAARLESICEPDGVTIAQETYSHVRDEIDAVALKPIRVKGIKDRVTPYAVQNILADWDESLRYIRRDDIRGMRLWVDLMRLTEEQRLASIRELEEAVDILKKKKIESAAE